MAALAVAVPVSSAALCRVSPFAAVARIRRTLSVYLSAWALIPPRTGNGKPFRPAFGMS